MANLTGRSYHTRPTNPLPAWRIACRVVACLAALAVWVIAVAGLVMRY